MKRTIVCLVAVFAAIVTASASPQHRRLFPPEQLAMLEVPDRDAWQRPDQVMDALRIAEGSTVADLGAGGGWFTIRLANRVGPNGIVYAEDIQPQMIEAIKRRVDRAQLTNVRTILGTSTDPHLPSDLDAVLLVDSYHEMEHPVLILRHVAAVLKPDGRLGIVEFTKKGFGPGPPVEERVDPERVVRDAAEAGLRLISREAFLRYQYMLVFGKQDVTRPDRVIGARDVRGSYELRGSFSDAGADDDVYSLARTSFHNAGITAAAMQILTMSAGKNG